MKKEEAMGNLHERARRLIDEERVEGLAPAERRWLQDHLATCEACAGWQVSTESAVRAFKSVPVAVPQGLAAATSLRVREHAAEMKQRRSRNLALVVGCVISWVTGVASAPLVWRLCEWFGTTLDLPRIVWQLGFLAWWFVPAAFAGLVILVAQARARDEDSNGWLGTGPPPDKR